MNVKHIIALSLLTTSAMADPVMTATPLQTTCRYGYNCTINANYTLSITNDTDQAQVWEVYFNLNSDLSLLKRFHKQFNVAPHTTLNTTHKNNLDFTPHNAGLHAVIAGIEAIHNKEYVISNRANLYIQS